MRKISFSFERQQKRVQQITTKWFRKGYSVRKVRKMVQERYGISVSDVALVYDKDKNIFRKKKNVKPATLKKQKTRYKQAMIKNIHKKMQLEQAKNISTEKFFMKYFSTDVSMADFKELAKVTGITANWENMTQQEYYEELQAFTDYAEKFFKKHEFDTADELDNLSDAELDIYVLGARALGKSPLL